MITSIIRILRYSKAVLRIKKTKTDDGVSYVVHHHLSYVATLSENIAYSMLCHRLTTFLPFTMYIPRCSCLFCVPMRLP